MDRTVGSVLVVAVMCTLGLALAVGAVGAQETYDPVDIEMSVSVTADGEIDEYAFTVEMSDEQYYDMLEHGPEEYDTVSDMLADDFLMEDEFGAVGETSDTDLGDRYAVHVTMVEVDVSEFDDITVTTDDGVTLEFDVEEPHEDVEDSVTLDAEMPGTVTDSNADQVDGTVATWHLHESPPETAFATTGDGSVGDGDDNDDGDGTGGDADDGDAAEDGDEADDTADDGDEADDTADDEDGAPGFGVVAAVVALVGGLAFYRNRV